MASSASSPRSGGGVAAISTIGTVYSAVQLPVIPQPTFFLARNYLIPFLF